MGNPEGNRPVRRPRLRWEDNINMGFSESEMWKYRLERAGLG
jgi:hypothetical protein